MVLKSSSTWSCTQAQTCIYPLKRTGPSSQTQECSPRCSCPAPVGSGWVLYFCMTCGAWSTSVAWPECSPSSTVLAHTRKGSKLLLIPSREPEADTCPHMFLPDTPFPYTAAFLLGLLMKGGKQRLARVSASPPASSWALERKSVLRPMHQIRQFCRVWTLWTQNVLTRQHIGCWVRMRQRALSIEMIFSSQKKHLPQRALA